jgi:hypothetical protein
MRVGDTLDNVNAITKKINAPGGLLQVTGKAVAKADNLIGHTDILVANQQKSIALIDAQISSTMQHLDLVLDATTTDEDQITAATTITLQNTAETVATIGPMVSNLKDEAQELKTATASLNTLLSDPDLIATEKNVAGTTKNLQDTTQDAKDYMHGLLHPTWVQRVWGVTLDIAGHLLDPF